MNREERRKAKKEIGGNIPKLSKEAKSNLFKLIWWQTNDELIDSIDRLFLKTPFIDEYMRTMNVSIRPISIRGVFDSNEINAKGIAMTMLYCNFWINAESIKALGMSKSTFRLPDWDKSKFQYDERAKDAPTALLQIVYDFRMKKGF